MTRAQLQSLLRFYAESGLDYPIDANAADRFAPAPPAVPVKAEPAPVPSDRSSAYTQPKPAPQAPVPAAVPPDADAVAMAQSVAAAAADLDALAQAVSGFEGCNLRRSARQAVFEGGARGASLMLVGAAPSRDDDQNAAAMSGLDGIMLDKMLAAIGLDRGSDCYIGFCVPWAVPGGEPPTDLHLRICSPFIARQIELARPNIVVALGNGAARHLMEQTKPITRLRGTWQQRTFGAHETTITAMYDPAFLRAQPRMKRQAWLDLLALRARGDGR